MAGTTFQIAATLGALEDLKTVLDGTSGSGAGGGPYPFPHPYQDYSKIVGEDANGGPVKGGFGWDRQRPRGAATPGHPVLRMRAVRPVTGGPPRATLQRVCSRPGMGVRPVLLPSPREGNLLRPADVS